MAHRPFRRAAKPVVEPKPSEPVFNEVGDVTFASKPVVGKEDKKKDDSHSWFDSAVGKARRLAKAIEDLTAAGPGKITQKDLTDLHRAAQDLIDRLTSSAGKSGNGSVLPTNE